MCLTDLANPQYKVVSAQGFEPRTHALEGRCSIQLSYAPIFFNGAGEGDRTLTAGLEGRNSTIELHPHIYIVDNIYIFIHLFWWRMVDSNHRKQC